MTFTGFRFTVATTSGARGLGGIVSGQEVIFAECSPGSGRYLLKLLTFDPMPEREVTSLMGLGWDLA